ncbi:trans-sulfuration enzyme family protein [Candidatus Protochlamydia phocaeensis]|uniref:trans-sulfuration enzyme family protein n=1 Tax=Candidatus Protochlamydia phocaeensis TaxID=1414722 RepID=UPI000839578D|nr:PLP-dependent aspartate aminotransferase family protein [Candidatus Protochlamydia phocaeensis]
MEFATRAIHIGWEPDPLTGSVMPPIYMTSTFALDAPGHSRGFEYTRANNPNFVILEKTLASLEDAAYATVFSSGIGALMALASTLSKGDKVLAIDGIYGGTYRLFNQILDQFGIEFITLFSTSFEEIDQALAVHKPKWLLFETPTNPLMNIFDIAELAKLAKRHGALSVVDNTFASPYCQNPFNWGADIVWHSTTKYIGGHSDVLGGVVMCQDENFKKRMDFARKTLGVNPSPFDCWLITRGVKTLKVRMEQHQRNALAIAQFLKQHPKVKQVNYPGLPSHPNHALAKKQMRAFNGMLSAEFHLSLDDTLKMIASFRYFTLAESLGGIESLVSHPVTMTHAIIPKQERDQLGLRDGLVRFSIGLEEASDLIEDLENSLKRIG